jgi:hypothetical protein
VVGYNGGERAFVSFATCRLRLTIYWRRAGLVVRSWDSYLPDRTSVRYAHVMHGNNGTYILHMHTLVTCLQTSGSRLHARIPGSAPAVDLDPEQPYRRPWIGPGQGAVVGWHEGRCICGIPLQTPTTHRRILTSHSQLPADTAFWTCSDCATVWRQVFVQRLLPSGFARTATQRVCV